MARSRGELLARADPCEHSGSASRRAHEERDHCDVGTFPQLEGEMTSWVPGEKSPNRLDALVWAITALAIRGRPASMKRIR